MNSSLALLVCRRNDSIESSSRRAIEQPLLYLISDHANAQCMDERDRIFGLCSLAMPCCVEAVPVDYSRPYSQICDMVLAHHCTFHADESDGALRDSRYFHHSMKTTLEKHEQTLESHVRSCGIGRSTPVQGYDVAIRAYIKSRIVWLSPVLTSPILPEDFHMPFVPDVLRKLMEPLHQIIYTDFVGTLPITARLDLVRPILSRGERFHKIRSRGPILTPFTSISSKTWSAIIAHAERCRASSASASYQRRLSSALSTHGIELFSQEGTIASTPDTGKINSRQYGGHKVDSRSISDLMRPYEVEDMVFQVLSALREAIPISRRSSIR